MITKAQLKSVLFASSNDGTRNALCSVLFEKDRLVSTDGHRLHIVEVDEYGCVNPFLISADDARCLHSTLRRNDSVEIVDHSDSFSPVSIYSQREKVKSIIMPFRIDPDRQARPSKDSWEAPEVDPEARQVARGPAPEKAEVIETRETREDRLARRMGGVQ